MRHKILLTSYFFFLIPFSFVISSCARAKMTVIPPSMAEYAPCNESSTSDFIAQRAERLKTLKGTASVEIELRNGRKILGRALILIKRPGHLRIEMLGPFNQTIAVFTYNGKTASLFLPQENKHYRGDFLFADVSKFPHYFLGVPAGNKENQESAPPNEEERPAPSSLPPLPCVYTNSFNERLWINQKGDIERIQFQTSGACEACENHLTEVTMDSYQGISGLPFPLAISIKNDEGRIALHYNTIELNVPVAEDSFFLPQQEENAPPLSEDIR